MVKRPSVKETIATDTVGTQRRGHYQPGIKEERVMVRFPGKGVLGLNYKGKVGRIQRHSSQRKAREAKRIDETGM